MAYRTPGNLGERREVFRGHLGGRLSWLRPVLVVGIGLVYFVTLGSCSIVAKGEQTVAFVMVTVLLAIILLIIGESRIAVSVTLGSDARITAKTSSGLVSRLFFATSPCVLPRAHVLGACARTVEVTTKYGTREGCMLALRTTEGDELPFSPDVSPHATRETIDELCRGIDRALATI